MIRKNHIQSDNPTDLTNPQAHLPYWLPIVSSKKKKKCCKKFKKGKRCKKCPGNIWEL